jgi:hypothetical protein
MRTERYRFIEWKGTETDNGVYELYDLAKDPRETVNIANQPQHAELVATLSKQLAAGWRAATPTP